jgi:hypothetical protein
MIQRHPTFLVSSLNIHRLLITALMLAAKFCEDTYVWLLWLWGWQWLREILAVAAWQCGGGADF